jgi:glycosyltransferase involved in cell wall biosynthesis
VKALIDGHMLGAGETGNETYVRGLLSGLEELGRREAVAVSGPDVDIGAHEAVVLPHRPAAANWARLLTDLARAGRGCGADLIHSTYATPLRTPLARVVTVHDVSFLRHPEWFTPRDRAVLNAGVRSSVRLAQRVITPSAHARDELSELLCVPQSRVVVTPEGAGEGFKPLCDAETVSILSRLSVTQPYVLAVGNLQPRKNLARLLEAWQLLVRVGLAGAGATDGKDPGGCHLVIAGGHRGVREPIEQMVATRGLADSVRLLGYVPHEDLPGLYRGARVFVFPTLYEGFGLPLLEAMACSAPVACSRVASLPEVAGDADPAGPAAAFFDPLDAGDIAATLGALLTDDTVRAALSARGHRRAARFSWRACAEATLAAYEAAVGERSSRRSGA